MNGKAMLKQRLKDNKRSYTPNREAIFSFLQSREEPATIAQIQHRLTDIDRVTIYRTLELFEELNIAKRVWYGSRNRVELSDDFKAHHHHVHCERCGFIAEIDSEQIEVLIREITRNAGYRPTSHQLEAYGLCGRCSGRNG